MSNDNKGQVLHSLKELGGLVLTSPPELSGIPELPGLGFGNLEDLKAQAKKIGEEAEKIQRWVRSTFGELAALALAGRVVHELVPEENIAKVKDDLAKLLEHPTPAYRRAAWLGLLEFEFSRELSSRVEVEDLLNQLVKEDRLVEAADGDLNAYHKAYSVHPDSHFGEPEKAEIKKMLTSLLHRVYQETGKTWEDKANTLRNIATSSNLQELIANKPGRYAVEVPTEVDQRNGKRRSGGVLLVISNGQDITPLNASGGIEGSIQEARKLGVLLKIHSLSWNSPPSIQKLLELNLTEDQAKKIQFLWYLLKRAISAKDEMDRIAHAKEAYASRVTVTPEEFFLEKKPGICLVEFQGTWENLDGSAGPTNLFFLVERKEEGGRIRLADVPNHLGNFFASCMSEYEEGNKLEGIAQPLRAVLQATFGQVVKASQDAKKVGQIANSN